MTRHGPSHCPSQPGQSCRTFPACAERSHPASRARAHCPRHRCPVAQMRRPVILNYRPGEQYRPHYDFCDLDLPGPAKGCRREWTARADIRDLSERRLHGRRNRLPRLNWRFVTQRRRSILVSVDRRETRSGYVTRWPVHAGWRKVAVFPVGARPPGGSLPLKRCSSSCCVMGKRRSRKRTSSQQLQTTGAQSGLDVIGSHLRPHGRDPHHGSDQTHNSSYRSRGHGDGRSTRRVCCADCASTLRTFFDKGPVRTHFEDQAERVSRCLHSRRGLNSCSPACTWAFDPFKNLPASSVASLRICATRTLVSPAGRSKSTARGIPTPTTSST